MPRRATADLYQAKFEDEGPMDRSGNVLPTRRLFDSDQETPVAKSVWEKSTLAQASPGSANPPQAALAAPGSADPPQAVQAQQQDEVRLTAKQLEETNQEFSQMLVAGIALVILIGAIVLMTCSKSDGKGLMGGGGTGKGNTVFGVEGGKFAWESLNAL